MKTVTANLRHFSRIPFASHVRLVGAQGSVSTQLLDISLKGALVKCPTGWVLEPGAALEMELILGGNSEAAIKMQTCVAHVEQDQQRVGLRCQHIDLDSITHLRRLVELNMGNPALLDRELASMG